MTCLSRRRFENPIVEKLDPRDISIIGLPANEYPGVGARMPITKRWSRFGVRHPDPSRYDAL